MVDEGVEAVSENRYHSHQYNEVAVFTHRHQGDAEPHTHHSCVWDGTRSYTRDADGRPTPDEATPLDDLRVPLAPT